EELAIVLNELAPHVLSRGIVPCLIKNHKNEGKLIYLDENGKFIKVYDPKKHTTTKHELMHGFLSLMPQPLIHPIILGSQKTHDHFKTGKKETCLAVLSTHESILSYYEWAKKQNNINKIYLFTTIETQNTNHLLRQLGTRDSENRIYCYE
ncbi:MAG: hypothetical protein AABY22_27250, partial [Nanoarchaeota archaeon]